MKGYPAMAAEIIDLAAVRNARRPKPEPVPEPTPEQRAAQDFLDLFVPVGSITPRKRSRKRPT
jgi:hypothetical protein